MYYQLTDHVIVSADLDRTWAFFSDASNLPKITPAWMQFSIRTPGPIDIQQDSIIDYQIKWMGIPIGWRTRIIDWSPKKQFIDLQIKGPYALWHHQHTFSPVEGGVECRDRVIYKLPLGWLGRIGHPIAVRKQLTEIFQFRRTAIATLLGPVRAMGDVSIQPI